MIRLIRLNTTFREVLLCMNTPKQTSSRTSISLSALGRRVREARKSLGLTQQELAAPQFGKAYVSAIERGTVRPSLKALDFFAGRLGIPASTLLSATETPQQEAEVQLEAFVEDLQYQINYAKMLIRSNQVDKALEAIAEAQQSAQP